MSIVMFLFFILFNISNNIYSWRTIHKKGFFGWIGIPGIDKYKKQSIIETFTHNGFLQGIYLDVDSKGEQIIYPINQTIKTQKLELFQKTGIQIPNHYFSIFILYLLQCITKNRINLFGSANTALFQSSNRELYALFERDLPYKLNYLDYQKKSNQSIVSKRLWINGIQTFSGHSKKRFIDLKTEVIDSLEYNIVKKTITHNVLSNDLKNVIRKTKYKSKYIPFVHDFFVLQNNNSNSNNETLFWVDSPFSFFPNSFLDFSFPIGLNKEKPTIFHVGKEEYIYEKGIALFHIALFTETETYYEIYTSIYEDLHFSQDIKQLKGIYVCIRLFKETLLSPASSSEFNRTIPFSAPLFSKTLLSPASSSEFNRTIPFSAPLFSKTKKVEIIKNPLFENYNLDFPIIYNHKQKNSNNKKQVILRNIDDKTKNINGFIICEELNIINSLFIHSNETHTNACIGEHIVIEDGGEPYVLFIMESIKKKDNEKNTFLGKWNIRTNNVEYYNVQFSFDSSFHSIWIDK